MAEDVKVPALGPMKKKILIPIAVAAAGFVGYRYWVARNAVGTGDPTDPGMEDPGVIPGVAGAVKPGNDYGIPDSTQTGSGGGFRGTSNSQWTEYVTDRLQQDGRWSYSVIAVALGNYLTAKPTTGEQQEIVRAALGIAGYPPVAGYALVTGGDTGITIAPTGLTGTATPDSITVHFTAVPGAVTYNGFVNGGAGGRATSTGTSMTFSGLTPGTSYSLQVAGVTAAGVTGPKSSAIAVKTTAAGIGKPSQPAITANTGGGRVTFTTGKVPYATSYRWFLNGKIFNTTNTPSVTLTSLKPKARYSPGVTVQAQAATGPAGAMSTAKSFTTK